MMQMKKHKLSIYVLVLAFIVSLFSVNAPRVEAKAKTTKAKKVTYNYTVGEARYLYGITNLKVKGKAKKVKVGVNKNDVKLRTAGYYSSSSAYKTQKKYEAARDKYKYVTTYDYDIYFLKAGTYTITYNTYEAYATSKYVSGKGYYYGPGRITKHTEKIKVTGSGSGVKSVKFGKAISYYSYSKSGTKTTTVTKKNPYVSSNTATLTINMNKGYKIKKVEVETYDPDNGWVTQTYTVKNKTKFTRKKVKVNTYKSEYASKNYKPVTYINITYTTPDKYTNTEYYSFEYSK